MIPDQGILLQVLPSQAALAMSVRIPVLPGRLQVMRSPGTIPVLHGLAVAPQGQIRPNHELLPSQEALLRPGLIISHGAVTISEALLLQGTTALSSEVPLPGAPVLLFAALLPEVTALPPEAAALPGVLAKVVVHLEARDNSMS